MMQPGRQAGRQLRQAGRHLLAGQGDRQASRARVASARSLGRTPRAVLSVLECLAQRHKRRMSKAPVPTPARASFPFPPRRSRAPSVLALGSGPEFRAPPPAPATQRIAAQSMSGPETGVLASSLDSWRVMR